MMTLVVNYAFNNLGTIETCCQMQSTSPLVLFDVGFSSEARLMAINSPNLHLLLRCLPHETKEERG